MELQSSKTIQKRDPEIQKFFQLQINRFIMGQYRYGNPAREQNYMTRAIMEMKAYKRTGNMESLLNIANYCMLESMAPENKKFHFDPNVTSVTRGKMKCEK